MLDMIVKPGHTSVEMDGTVRLQYLETWCLQHQQQGGNSSSLVELVQIMALAFSHEPPLFTRPPGYSLQQPPGHAHPANTGYSVSASYGTHMQ
jgi:ESCRT-I complex subunit TSG101